MTAVALFAKAPRPGFVKTRLARDVGPARAAEVYRHVGARVAAAVGAAFPLTVWYEPAGALPEMRAWLGEREFRPQPLGDLGHRLGHAVGYHLARGDGPVVLIGADAPGVDAVVVADAVRGLERADVVVGPALDGGYYLLGLLAKAPALFEGIAWGSTTVLAETLSRAAAAGLSVARLDPLRDVDTAADLAALGFDRP